MTVAGDLLREAATIVDGDRNATHGDKERSFSVIAEFWQTYLDGRKVPGPLNGRDVAQMMVLLKIARSIQGTPVKDHFTDECGYAAIAGECALGEERMERMLAGLQAELAKTEAAESIHDRIAETACVPPKPLRNELAASVVIHPCGCYRRDDEPACTHCTSGVSHAG